VTIPVAGLTHFLIGANQVGSERVKVAGLQYHCSAVTPLWISRDDYPEPPAAATSADLASRDAANLARSEAYKSRTITGIQAPTGKYCVKVVYGQSLGAGHDARYPLSTVNRFGNLTLGAAVRPDSLYDDTGYSQIGAATLQPLVARGDIADGIFSEPVNFGWVNNAKALHNDLGAVENDTARLFVTYNAAVSGQTIEELAKVPPSGQPNYYARFTQGLSKIVAAGGAGPTVMDAICWMQGEFNYTTDIPGAIRTKSGYKTRFAQIISDMRSDARAITGQAKPPAFLTYQTGAQYTRPVDSNGVPGLHVGMAQLETALETPGVFMVGPTYPYPDWGGHLTSNGYRWFGAMIAKVHHKVVRLRQDWSPLRPIAITQDGNDILVDFHVPEGPLVFDAIYEARAPVTLADKGFRVTDNSGEVPITVTLAGDTIVRLACGRATVGTAYVWYAGQDGFGGGNLRDSDPALSDDLYVFNAGLAPGQDASENIAALVGKPYPLWNWCIAFHYPVGFAS
jgi:hypothetical protein